jgi:hypothetical protein
MAPNRIFFALTHLFIATIAVVAAAQPASRELSRELLNSERIAAVFGSYGVAVLEQDDTVRVSNLFSGTGQERTCRTFAIVRYSDRIDPALGTEHAAIVAGGSIGATLAAAGWQVRKTHLRYGVLTATPRLASLMHVVAGTTLAMHVYSLDVAKDDRTLEYAALVEIHHPDYLTSDDLAEIYGPADEGARPELVAALLATATATAARSPSPQ